MQKQPESSGNYQFNFSWISYIPVILLLGVVPLIVRLTMIPLDEEVIKIFGVTQKSDFFAQYKAGAIYVITGFILLNLFLSYNKKNSKLEGYYKNYYIAAGLFVIMTMLSAFTSEYRSIALWGIFDRAEGAVMIGCYIIMCFYTLYIFNKQNDYRYIVWPLCFLIIVMTVIGFFQYIGKDIFTTYEWGKKLIIPEGYSEFANNLLGIHEKGHIYGTMYHYNYIGSFGAMMVPLFVTLTLFIKNKWEKIAYGLITLCSLFLLFGSRSRAGIMGLVGSIIVFLIIFIVYLAKKWKLIVPGIVLIGLIIFGFDTATDGAIFARIPSLVNDAVELFIPSSDTTDYKDKLVVRGISHEKGSMVIELQSDKLILTAEDKQLIFKNQNGESIAFVIDGDKYITQDARYSQIAFQRQVESSEDMSYYALLINNRIAFYLRASDSVHLVNSITIEDMELDNPEIFGFKGKERLGSARGYIWSRSLPMLKDTWVLGNGPDTYALEFPQNDLLGKLYAYDTTSMIVDKPHNLYLQIGINQGIIALVAFLVIIITYLISSLRLYAFKGDYQQKHVIGIAFALSIVGYLVAGIFNDSIVSVAPIFWVLLGAGMAINYLIQKENKKEYPNTEHATIDIKSRKHI